MSLGHIDTVYDQTYPDIDSIIHRYTGRSDIMFRSHRINDTVEYALVKSNGPSITTYAELSTPEMDVLDTEGRATYAIYSILSRTLMKNGPSSSSSHF
ncbi:MAG: hypothetical protein ACTSYL_10870 [Candidatus Thorarchaeota archaeon]